ncbi:glutaminase [Lacihabitans lacunae]|uniref:Glutaminase n=1 Tax=Lacihabitans lacunae TaxID=1028214 RepID=A0ABV7YQI8_9BACT
MNYKEIIEDIHKTVKSGENDGALASYIPELANVDVNKLGIHISTVEGFGFGTGDHLEKFSIQSIVKVLSLSLAFKIVGEDIWKRLDVEPSGTAFNSLSQLELDNGIPRNPFVNAGALVICDILISNLSNPKEEFLRFCQNIANNQELKYSDKITTSEKSVGYRNIALCNFIKSYGNILNDTDIVLDFYFTICSLEMSCQELSRIFLFLADNNFKGADGSQILTLSEAKRINAVMLTCGFYDESGEFAYRVGLPGKSGVGGGIIAIHPGKYCIAVWSPRLNYKGNSYRGMKFLEKFTTKTESSIF